MLTDLYAAIVSDGISLQKEFDFFEQSQERRTELLASHFGNYPQALREYFLKTPAQDAYVDLAQAITFLAGGKPLVSLIAREAQIHEAQHAQAEHESALLLAFELFLREVMPSLVPGGFCAGSGGVLGAYTARVFSADDSSTKQLCRVLYREASEFIGAKTGERAAEVQVAAPLSLEEELSLRKALSQKLRGSLVQVTVQRGLLGGGRLFHDGNLVDVSWRATLNRLFS